MGAKEMLTGRLLGNAQKFTEKQVAETLAMLVQSAVARGASDIHIEPHDRFILVRFRIDGALRSVHKLPRQTLSSLVSQLKTLADLNPEQTEMPQEGSYSVAGGEQKDVQVAVRVSVMPVFGGEKAVLHLSTERGQPQGLEALGFWGAGLAALQATLAQPHGFMLVAAPRHSGMSSTLFSFLHALNSPLLSIATVETHRSHRLPGVSQTFIASGMSIREGLQATLKQDPNIIMLGDIPDAGVAELAVQAAGRGHMVLAGLHADSAVAALLRLRSSGVEPFVLAAAFRAAVGQRLVRTLCPDCRERYALSLPEQRELARSFGITTASAFKRVHELERGAAPAIFGDVKQLNSSPTAITHLWRANPAGCDTCDRSGYAGRTAIVEVLHTSAAVQKILLSPETTPVPAAQAALLKDGFIPLALDGLIKALRGQTTVTEVLRAAAPALA